jgi:hypothetical protein
MRSTLRLFVPLQRLSVLSLVLLSGCCKRQTLPEPAPRVVTLPTSCVSPELRAGRPKPIDEALMICLDQGNRAEDCVAHDAKVRDKYIDRLLANCGGGAK